MVGLGFPEMNKKKKKDKDKDKQKKKKKLRLDGLRDGLHRHESPDSVIFTTTTDESNLSLFSSGCGSVVDRRSFASEFHDHDSLVSELSKHLASGRDVNECSSSPDLDSNIFSVQTTTNNCAMMRNEEKIEALEEEEEEGEDYQALDPAKSSFSLAVRECQNRRYTHEPVTVQKKPDRQRPVSLDLNNGGNNVNVNGSSPRHRRMRKSSVSSGRLDTFLSPGRSNYWQGSVGVLQKGWSSERVPLPINGGRRNVNAGFLPFNHGRTLPSKWEDAEKWICSPVGGDGPSCSPMPLPHRRPKSKSGPLGQPTVTYHPAYSPSIPTLEGVSVGTYTAGSPFSTGVLAANALPGRGHCRDSSSSSSGDGSRGSGGRTYAVHRESCIVRSASIHGWSTGVLAQPSLPGSKDEKQVGSKDAVTMKPRAVSKRDIATQMSPECSTRPSPKRTAFLSPSHPTSLLPIVELQSHPSKLEVRDVQVDDRVVVTRWSHRHGPLVSQKGFTDVKECKKKVSKTEVSAWEVAETAKSKREEARITAWENLQKAKAEAAIRKLEMKIEKKRSSKMDKIMNKLRSAQKKAQDMRSTVSVSSSEQTQQVAKVSKKKAIVSLRKRGQRSSLSGCFTCHAF